MRLTICYESTSKGTFLKKHQAKKIFSSMTGEHLKLQNPKKYEISLQMT